MRVETNKYEYVTINWWMFIDVIWNKITVRILSPLIRHRADKPAAAPEILKLAEAKPPKGRAPSPSGDEAEPPTDEPPSWRRSASFRNRQADPAREYKPTTHFAWHFTPCTHIIHMGYLHIIFVFIHMRERDADIKHEIPVSQWGSCGKVSFHSAYVNSYESSFRCYVMLTFSICVSGDKPVNNAVDHDTILRRTHSFENDKTWVLYYFIQGFCLLVLLYLIKIRVIKIFFF